MSAIAQPLSSLSQPPPQGEGQDIRAWAAECTVERSSTSFMSTLAAYDRFRRCSMRSSLGLVYDARLTTGESPEWLRLGRHQQEARKSLLDSMYLQRSADLEKQGRPSLG